jgi:SH3-like domain-containing protein
MLGIVLTLVGSLVIMIRRADRPWFQGFFAPGSLNSTPETVPSYANPAFTSTHSPQTRLAEKPTITPTPEPTSKPPLALAWSKEYSQVYLRQEPGGTIIRIIDNGSSLLVSEIQAVQGMEWAHVLYFDGEKDVEGWITASMVFTIRSDLPSASVTGEDGVNLRGEPGGALISWLPQGTPVQILETAEESGVIWAHVILPDERAGWIVQRLLNTIRP